jgi:hypothetical protein
MAVIATIRVDRNSLTSKRINNGKADFANSFNPAVDYKTFTVNK